MANETPAKPQAGSPAPSLETRVATNPSVSIDMGQGKGAKAKATNIPGTSVEMDQQRVAVRSGPTPDADTDEAEVGPRAAGAAETPQDGDPEPAGDEPEADAEGDEGAAEAATEEDLGEFKADDAEVAAKFEARYVAQDGTLNVGNLTTEFWNNAAAEKPSLNEGTYAFLEKRFGIPKEFAKAHEAGILAMRSQRDAEVVARVGGQERLDAALNWARNGGYAEADRKRFTAVVQGTDEGAANDALDALMARYEKANPSSGKPSSTDRPGRRPVSPVRSVTATTETRPSGAKPFKDASEMHKERKEAFGSKDQAKIDAWRSRVGASKKQPWFNGGQ